jgi:hypothetical protein
MMDVFTSSYMAWAPDMGLPVVCSLTRPKWLMPDGQPWTAAASCEPLTPLWRYFKKPDAGEQFEAQLARYGAKRIADILGDIAAQHDAHRLVLLCWERDWGTSETPLCHRLRIARFMLETTGWLIRELGAPKPPPEGALF